MFGEIPVIEREGTFGRIGARIVGSQAPGCHIGEFYKGTLHLSDRWTDCDYQRKREGCENASTAESTRGLYLVQ